MKKWILLLILIISMSLIVYAAPRYRTLAELYRLDRVLDLNQSGQSMTLDNLSVDKVVANSVTIGGTNVTPNDYLQNGTDVSLKDLNVTNLNVTGISNFNGTMDLHMNPIKNIFSLSAPDGSIIAFGNNPAFSAFSGLDNSIVFGTNQSLPAGEEAFSFLDIFTAEPVFILTSVKNDSGAYLHNSLCALPSLGETNASELTNCEKNLNRFGITPFADYNTGENKTTIASFVFEGTQLFIHDDIGTGQSVFEGDFRVIAREGTDIDLYQAPVHIRNQLIRELGLPADFTFVHLIEDFETATLGEFTLTTSGKGLSEWAVDTGTDCPNATVGDGLFCVRAGPTGGSGATIIQTNFSTINEGSFTFAFALNTQDMGSGGNFNISLNNNSGSGDIFIFNLSGIDQFNTFTTFDSIVGMSNISKITLQLSFFSTHPIRGQVWVDKIQINATTLSSTLENVTVQDGRIDLGDGTCFIYLKETDEYNLTINCPNIHILGNLTEENLNIISTNATGDIEAENLIARNHVNATVAMFADGVKLTAWQLANFTGAFNTIYNISDTSLLYNGTDASLKFLNLTTLNITSTATINNLIVGLRKVNISSTGDVNATKFYASDFIKRGVSVATITNLDDNTTFLQAEINKNYTELLARDVILNNTLAKLEGGNTFSDLQIFDDAVVFRSNVTLVTAGTSFVNESIIVFELDGSTGAVINASGDSYFDNSVGIGNTGPLYPLDIVGDVNQVNMRLSTSDAAGSIDRFGGFVIRHGDDSEEDIVGLVAFSDVNFGGVPQANQLFWGGGSSNFNAATHQFFYAAATPTTTTGTLTMTLTGGNIAIAGALQTTGQLSLDGTIGVDQRINFGGTETFSRAATGALTVSTNANDIVLSPARNVLIDTGILSLDGTGAYINVIGAQKIQLGSQDFAVRSSVTGTVNISTNANHLVLVPAGNVGIGSDVTPNAKLDVQGTLQVDSTSTFSDQVSIIDSTTDAILKIESDSPDTQPFILFNENDDSTSPWLLGIEYDSASFEWKNGNAAWDTANTEMILTESGDLVVTGTVTMPIATTSERMVLFGCEDGDSSGDVDTGTECCAVFDYTSCKYTFEISGNSVADDTCARDWGTSDYIAVCYI